MNNSLIVNDEQQNLKSSRLFDKIDLQQTLLVERQKTHILISLFKRVFKRKSKLTLDQLIEKQIIVRQRNLQIKRLELIGDSIYDSALPVKKEQLIDIIVKYTQWFDIIQPDSIWLVLWNVVVATVILYYIFEIGLVIFLGKVVWESQINKAWSFTFDIFSIFVLIIDIVVSLNKGYYQQGILIVDRRKIVSKYIPYFALNDVIGLFIISIALINQSHFLNYFKLFLFGKLINLYQIDITFQRVLMTNMKLNSAYLIFRQIVMVLVASHYYAVTYFALSKWVFDTNYYGPSTPLLSWVYKCQAYTNLIAQPWETWYLYSLYFTIGVITTIAYGDIVPLNPIQAVYNIVFMTLCIIQFSYVIWNIIEILLMSRAAQSQKDNEYIQLKKLMRNKYVSSKTEVKVKAFIQQTWNAQTYRDRTIQNQLIQKLPLELKSQLMASVYQQFLNSLLILHKFPSSFVSVVSNIIQQYRYSINEIVFEQEQEEIKIYYLVGGKMNLCFGKKLIKLITGGSLGTLQFYQDTSFPFEGIAQQNINIYEIKKQKFIQIVNENKKYIQSSCYVRDLLRDTQSTALNFLHQCILCSSYDHYYSRCPVFFFRQTHQKTKLLLYGKPQKRLPFRKNRPVYIRSYKTLKKHKYNKLTKLFKNQNQQQKQLIYKDYEQGNLDNIDQFIEETHNILSEILQNLGESSTQVEQMQIDELYNYDVYFPRHNNKRITKEIFK